MPAKNKYSLIITGILMVLIMVAFSYSINKYSGQHAPDISFITLDGRKIILSEQIGKPVLITFWASTCHLCLAETPALISLYDDLKTTGLEIIGVAMPYDPPNRVIEFTKNLSINYPVALDINGDIIKSFGGVSATPTAFLISPEGKIISRYTGSLDIAKLRLEILEMTGHKDNLSGLYSVDSALNGYL